MKQNHYFLKLFNKRNVAKIQNLLQFTYRAQIACAKPQYDY